MDELVDRLVTTVGISREQAELALSNMLGFLKQAGPPDKVAELVERLPGAESVQTPRGGMGGMIGAMAAYNSLTSAGLDMGQIQGVARELIAYAKLHAGDELVNDVVASVPGLNQFA
ncbi:DUF2267 domain-containing protein [Microbaculum marinum]|uniref:DUF2267 domain-containing protein n=1 Tax=Microbaculum marinum TaxID=1764581 RepID=A0AAW9RM22_9HYPH